MITIFTTLKPFRDPHTITIQRNAIQSWVKLRPSCEIILLGKDEGVEKIAQEFSLTHIPTVKSNEQGLPLIRSLFQRTEKRASFSLLCYTNGDIIFMNDFLEAIKRVSGIKKEFLIVGRRWDAEIKRPLSFSGNWQKRLKNFVRKKATLHGSSGIDFFVFPKGTFPRIPDLVVGRGGWDNWMIFNARSRGIPVVDITQASTVIHQEHDFPGTREQAKRFTDESAMKNITLTGGLTNCLTIRDASWILQNGHLKRKWFSYLSLWYPWRLVLSIKRNVYQSLSQ